MKTLNSNSLSTKSISITGKLMRIRHRPKSIMALEFPVMEMDFVLSGFEFKVFT